MKKLLLPLLLASLGAGGCVAVPVDSGPYGYYDGGYAPAPVYVAPPTVVVRGTYYYRDGRRHRHR